MGLTRYDVIVILWDITGGHYMVQITFKVPEILKLRLEEIAQDLGLTISEVFRAALNGGLNVVAGFKPEDAAALTLRVNEQMMASQIMWQNRASLEDLRRELTDEEKLMIEIPEPRTWKESWERELERATKDLAETREQYEKGRNSADLEVRNSNQMTKKVMDQCEENLKIAKRELAKFDEAEAK